MSEVISNNREDLNTESELLGQDFLQKIKKQNTRIERMDNLLTKKMITQSYNKSNNTLVELSFEELCFYVLEEAVCQVVRHLHGPLNKKALISSFEELVERHETLRTVYCEEAQKVYRKIVDQNWFNVKHVQSRTSTDQMALIKELLEQDRNEIKVFDSPLFRVTLIHCSDDHHILMVSAHHIIFDGWAYDVLVNELTVLYNAYGDENVTPLQPLTMQYSDYVQWQQQWFQNNGIDRIREYWLTRLKDSPSELAMPTDKKRENLKSTLAGILTVPLSSEVNNNFFSLARDIGATQFTALVAIVNIMIAHYSCQRDITIAYTNAGRFKPEHAGMIANYFNSMVFRYVVDLQLSFRELLIDVRQLAFKDYAHREMPFCLLKRYLNQQSEKQYTNLFQVTINTQPECGTLDLKDIEVVEVPLIELLKDHDQFNQRQPVGPDGSDFGLSLASGTMMLYYNKELYSEERMTQMMDYLCKIMENVVKYPDRSLDKLIS